MFFSQANNVALYMFLQVLTKGAVTVSEGGDVEYIEIAATLPPRFICASSEALASANGTCEISIYGFLEIEAADRQCSDGSKIPQAVIGWPQSYGDDITVPCGVKVMETNWFWILRLAVKAKVDLIKDKNYKRDLTVVQNISVGIMESVVNLEVIEVGVFVRLIFADYISYEHYNSLLN